MTTEDEDAVLGPLPPLPSEIWDALLERAFLAPPDADDEALVPTFEEQQDPDPGEDWSTDLTSSDDPFSPFDDGTSGHDGVDPDHWADIES